MAVATQHPAIEPTDSPSAEPGPRLFTIDELEAMVRLGIIGQDERVELIEGQIVKMNPQGTGHIWSVTRLIEHFARRPGTTIATQGTLQLVEWSGPEPDLVVLRASASRRRRPTANDALLVVEVANTSLRYDRETKAPLYARAGIPEYWIVDLNGERIEAYTEPAEDGYHAVRIYVRSEQLAPLFEPSLSVSVDAILGPVGDDEDDESASGEASPEN